MKLLIDIPKEFEQHFKTDRFEDSLNRLSADAHLLAGLYEQETALMLIEAFKNAVLIPPHGELIDLRTVNLEDGPYEYQDWVEWALEQYQNAPVFIKGE